MSDERLAYISAAESRRRFAARALSPVELLEELIARAERIEPRINAFASTYYDRALEQARESEARFMKTDGRPRPLEGLPLAVKTNSDSAVRGTISTNGCLWLAGNVDDHTSPAMERLLEAGAIVHARTTMPELGWAWTCVTRVHGTTRNPWNPAYTSGGSSSGSAAAVAAGTATLASATDALGSLRHPAAMCGVVGFKPPYGRNPLHPKFAFDFFKHIGPIARTVEDCALMQNVMSGPHPLDHTTVPEKLTLGLPFEGIRGLEIAYSLDLGYFPVTDDVRRETLASLEALREAGARTTEVPVPWAEPVIRAAGRYVDRIYGDGFERALREHPEEICDYTAYYAREAAEVTAEELHGAMELAGFTWRDHFGPLFQHYDAFVCPTLAFHDVPAENRPWEQNIVVRGRSYTDHDGVMTGLFNMYSRCPVIVVPSGFTTGGLPTSLQIAARPFDDTTVFRVAAALERLRPWLDTPERRPKLLEAETRPSSREAEPRREDIRERHGRSEAESFLPSRI